MDWLKAFRTFKRATPEKVSISYDWHSKTAEISNSIHPFVTVHENLLESQVEFARVLLAAYAEFIDGLAEIYGYQFANLVRKKNEADVYECDGFGTSKKERLASLIRTLCARSVADEDQFDRHRVMKFCQTLED